MPRPSASTVKCSGTPAAGFIVCPRTSRAPAARGRSTSLEDPDGFLQVGNADHVETVRRRARFPELVQRSEEYHRVGTASSFDLLLDAANGGDRAVEFDLTRSRDEPSAGQVLRAEE